MLLYKFHFLNEETLTLSEAEFAEFMRCCTVNPSINIYIDFQTKRGFNMHNMTYFEEIEQVVGEGKVVKPLTPAELREEKQAMATTTPTDLGHQLDHPDLGKNE